MLLLKIKLMEELKIKGKESTTTFKTRSDHCNKVEEALLYIIMATCMFMMLQNAKFVEGVDGVSVVGPPKREQIQQQVQFILKWDQ